MMRFAAVGCNRLLGGGLARRVNLVTFTIELEREDDGCWIAEVPALDFSNVTFSAA